MIDISSEVSVFDGASNGPDFKESLINLLIGVNDGVEDFDYSEFYNGCIYRGASLGSGATFETASTSEQRAAIKDGSFADMYIGDYWTIDNKVFRIADFNYWKYIGDTSFNQNHLVLVPDAIMGSSKMNTENDTTGAYVGSKMYTDSESALNTARTTISNLFGNYLGTHRSYLANAVSNGAESAGAWVDSSVDLMSEIMVYGSKIRSKANDGSYIATSDKTQLALFRLNPDFIVNKRAAWWLRDVVSSSSFAYVSGGGFANLSSASSSLGVRPAFAVIVPN